MKRRMYLALAALAALMAMAVAYAMDVPMDPAAWGSNPAVAIVALAAFVAWLRTTPFGQRIDGPYLVPAVTVGIGAVAGGALHITGYLTLAPYATWAVPVGGVAYGALVAISSILGVSLFNYGAGKLSTTGATARQAVTNFIIQFLHDRFGDKIPAAAWAAVGPILIEFAASEAVLTDELRRNLQARLLDALRKAGLPGKDL